MEAQQRAESQEDLIKWVGDHDYLAVRTEDPTLMEKDYRKTLRIPPMCVFVLIDLDNMRVLEENGGQCTEKRAEEFIDKHL